MRNPIKKARLDSSLRRTEVATLPQRTFAGGRLVRITFTDDSFLR